MEELRRTKANDAVEITRLKKELATMREVLRSYVLQIDSLNRLNTELTTQNEDLRRSNEEQQQQISIYVCIYIYTVIWYKTIVV